MAPVNTWASPVASALWLMSDFVSPPEVMVAFAPVSAFTWSLVTITATVAPTEPLAGAADSEPAMIRALLPSFAVTSAPCTMLTETLSPSVALTWLLLTATAKEPASEALAFEPAFLFTEPAMASTYVFWLDRKFRPSAASNRFSVVRLISAL